MTSRRYWGFGTLLLISVPVAGQRDFFQTVAGIDYDRHIWMHAHPCAADPLLVESMPGLHRAGVPCMKDRTETAPAPVPAPFALSWEQSYRRLIRKTGSFRLDHDESGPALGMHLNPAPGVALHSSWIGTERRRVYAQSDYGGVQEDSPRQVRGSAEFAARPWLVPVVAGGTGSDGYREAAVALRGSAAGFSWGIASGLNHRREPLILELENYSPMTIPLFLRRDFHAATGKWEGENAGVFWTGRLERTRHPETFEAGYSLADSGRNLEHAGGFFLQDSPSRGRYRISLEGGTLTGRHTFRGVNTGTEGTYQFSYAEARNHVRWARADAQASTGRVTYGAFAGASRLDWEIPRPETAAGRHFWDRNGVLDSYEGNVFGVFSRETWLFDGAAAFRQTAAGAWLAAPAGGWRARGGLTWHLVELHARGHLTKRTSSLLIAYSEKDYHPEFPGVRAHLLTPELTLTRVLGNLGVAVSVRQALPVHVRLRREDGTAATDRGLPGSSSYSGGTEARLQLGWRFFARNDSRERLGKPVR